MARLEVTREMLPSVTPSERFKTSFFRTMPIAAGAALGLVIVRPPAFLAALGWGMYVVAALLAFCVVVGLVVVLVAANLPAKVELTPEPGRALTGDLGVLVAEVRKLGFRDVGPSLRVSLMPPATLVGFLHERGQTYASVFLPGARGASPTYDFVSMLGGGRGGLTSAESPLAGALPVRPGSLRQLFPKRNMAEVWRRHQEAVAYLRQQGVAIDAPSAEAFAEEYRVAYASMRKAFFAHTLRNSLVTLWRAATKTTPELRSIIGRTNLAPTLALLRAAKDEEKP